ncbi:MAG: methylenetetrahydrofolate reductase [Heliobacteriaceae bacterium]|jgi:methylenetetrahydrofolate reductase (NADPH)|nr:methylenetetrahydrofolate reductase [Heliobacteriaceae bacterium]
MKLQEIYSKKNIQHNGAFEWVKPVISFEVFPPKENESEFFAELDKLKTHEPAFISLTCHAGKSIAPLTKGGSATPEVNPTRRGDSILERISESFNVMPHLTCVCSSKESVERDLQVISDMGIENILALRGDLPTTPLYSGGGLDSGFNYANELVEFIKEKSDLSVAVAGYPEGHIEAGNLFSDIENLKRKVDAGAQAIFTQLFFDNDKFFSFVQLVRDAGIEIPVIPGIMPIISLKQITRMTSLANITIPQSLMQRIEQYKNNPSDMKKLGTEFASYQCRQLIDAEVKGIHFYTLNKANAILQILEDIL